MTYLRISNIALKSNRHLHRTVKSSNTPISVKGYQPISEDVFESCLAAAIKNAKTEWEITFTTDLHERYLEHGMNALYSDTQLYKLIEMVEKINGN